MVSTGHRRAQIKVPQQRGFFEENIMVDETKDDMGIDAHEYQDTSMGLEDDNPTSEDINPEKPSPEELEEEAILEEDEEDEEEDLEEDEENLEGPPPGVLPE